MKFRNLMITALAAATLAGCSKDDNGPEINQVTGQQTYMKVNVTTVKANAKAHYGATEVTTAESAITELKLYVFHGSGDAAVFEKEVDLGVADKVSGTSANNDAYRKTVQIVAGDKVFLVAANLSYAGGYPAFTTGTTLASAHAALLSITETADAATGNEFWMTSTADNSATVSAIITEADADAGDNPIAIDLGRAVAKVGVYHPASTTTTDGTGTLTGVTYKMGNNPVSMFTFTSNVAGTGYVNTPFYDVTPVVTNYFKDASYFAAKATGTPLRFDDPWYMIENSNKVPRKGSSTMTYIKGVFTPAANTVYESDGITLDATYLQGTFYRTYNPETKTYGAKFFSAAPATEVVVLADLGLTSLPAGATTYADCIAEYTNGEAYYALYLRDLSQTSGYVAQYTVKRNNYWSVEITSVATCGENTEGKVDPWDPTGPDPQDPLVDETHIRATITVIDWIRVEQESGI